MNESNDSTIIKLEQIKNMCMTKATGGVCDERDYPKFRLHFINDPKLKSLIPKFIHSCRNMSEFWSFIKPLYRTYDERRKYISDEFSPAFELLENIYSEPINDLFEKNLIKFDSKNIIDRWNKLLEGKNTDPERTITLSRSLLEDVLKHISEENNLVIANGDDLNKLYKKVAESLNMAPEQHTEVVFKDILGGCQRIVNGLASIRNSLSDSHGKVKGYRKPNARHAALAANISATISLFLIESHLKNK